MGAVVGALGVLVASEMASFALGFLMEPVAVAVELILYEILVPDNVVFCAELFYFVPGRRFNFEALNV